MNVCFWLAGICTKLARSRSAKKGCRYTGVIVIILWVFLDKAPRVSEGMKRGMRERLSEEGLEEGETSNLEPGASSELGDLR